MSNLMLEPQGDFPKVGLVRRFAAIFYDFLLVMALIMVVTWVYQQGVLRLIHGSAELQRLSEAGALDSDPLLASLVLVSAFAFFATFWTKNGQTLGMQVWNIRVQSLSGKRISLMQALLRFVIAIFSWLVFGLGFWWQLFSKSRGTWHDIYSESQIVQLPKGVHKK